MAEDWVDIPKTAETADSSDWTDIPAAPTVLSRYRQTMTKAVKSGDPDQPAGTDAEQPNINYFPRPSTEGQTWMAAPNLEETQLNEQKLPEGVALNENKKPYNVNTGQELKVIPRPAAVPFIKTPEGDIQWSGSKLTDVISNLLPSPALKVAPKVAQVADRIYLPTAPVAEGLPIPEARGKGARLLPPETPHEPIALPEAPALPPRAGVGAEAAVGPLDGVSPEAINQVASDLKEAHFTPYTLDDKLEKMSPHQFLAEADENLETEAGKIAAMGGEARNTIVQNFDQRHSEVKQRLKSSYDSAFGPVENLAQERKTLTIDQQAAAAEFYKKFRNLEIYPTDELKEIMPRLQAADAFGEAKKIAAVEGFPWEESFFTTGTRKNYPTAESWDYVKRALDTKIEGSFNQFGEPTNWTRIYTNLKNKLVGAIDNHPNPEVAGVWKEARDAYAGPAKIKNSYDLGKKILSDAVDANEVPFLTASHSTKELEAIAQGIRYNLENQLGKAGPQEGRSIRQMISDNAQNKIRWIIGDEKAEKLFNSIDLENQMYGAPTRIYGGAATSKRVLGAVERYGPKPPPGAEALGTIVETGVNLLKEPKKTVTKTVSKFVTEKMARAAEEKAAKLRADIAHIYTLQGPERDVALRWILEHGEGFKGTPTRATGGSVFDKMHAAKHMAEGGGTDAPFNEWDAVPRNAEGIPQIRIEKPPVNEADEAQAAREAAAARVAGNVRGAPYEPTPPSTEGKTWMMEPGKEAVQSGNYENTLPPNVRLNDAGIPYNVETGEELQMARRPNVLPFTRTPDGVQWAMPKIAELAGDIVNPLAVTKGVALNPGEFALGSGPIKRSVLEQPNAPTFYSALDRAVSDIPQAKASAEQWAATLANRPGVKPEEIQWRGLDQYLAGRAGQTVTKQEIADHLAGNKVELGEVTKGEFSSSELDAAAVKARETGNWAEYDRLLNQAKSNETSNTKYHSYQLPGGENYKETLLTLPKEVSPIKTRLQEINKRTEAIQDEFDKLDKAPETKELKAQRLALYNEGGALKKERYKLHKEFETAPDVNFKSSHWDEPNPVTHMRTNERTIGNTASHHIEEVQSDWHQKGRTEGYADPDPAKRDIAARELLTAESELKKQIRRSDQSHYKEAIDNQVEFHANPERDVEFAEQWFGPEQQSAALRYMAAKREFSALAGGVPDAPFKKTWPDLTMKQALRDAVENGKDRLSWTPGEAQAKRYDLSKQVDSVHYNPDTQRLVAKRGNSNVIDQNGVPPDKLADYVGKDVARKIMGEEPNVNGLRSLRGENLKVGGEGMNEFYDKMLPKAVEKLGKAYGVKVQRGVDTTGNPVNYVDIPPAWKQEILKKGFPLFATGGSVFDKMKRASK